MTKDTAPSSIKPEKFTLASNDIISFDGESSYLLSIHPSNLDIQAEALQRILCVSGGYSEGDRAFITVQAASEKVYKVEANLNRDSNSLEFNVHFDKSNPPSSEDTNFVNAYLSSLGELYTSSYTVISKLGIVKDIDEDTYATLAQSIKPEESES